MMVASPLLAVDLEHIDQHVILHGVSWDLYERLLEGRGESSVPGMTYLEGELELMAPSFDHEMDKTTLGRLVEAWGEEMDIALTGIGSWTLKEKKEERGAEPDECYFLGTRRKPAPDIAIEVVSTRRAINKLEVYRKLHVREVWIWERGTLSFFELRRDRYVARKRSRLLPSFDPELIARCMSESTQLGALRLLRKLARK